MQFLFLVTVKKKILWKYIHALRIYQHDFHYQNVQHTIVLLFAMDKLVPFRKIEGAQCLKGIYDFFKKLFIISSILSEMCSQFFSFNVSNLEIKKYIHIVLCFGNKFI